MLNFTFQNPTKIIFGRGEISQLANEIPQEKRILLTYGGGSIKKTGIYDEVVASLEDHTFVEFGGIEPNPDLPIPVLSMTSDAEPVSSHLEAKPPDILHGFAP